MIKAVIFDFGEVLIGNGWEITYKQIAKRLKISEEKARDIMRPLERRWSKGKINEDYFWRSLSRKTNVKIDPRFTKDLFFLNMLKYTKDITESWKILAELKARRVRLTLLTNIIPPHIRALRERFARLKKLGFEFFICSSEVGFRKPDPKIYKIVLKKLNLLPTFFEPINIYELEKPQKQPKAAFGVLVTLSNPG